MKKTTLIAATSFLIVSLCYLTSYALTIDRVTSIPPVRLTLNGGTLTASIDGATGFRSGVLNVPDWNDFGAKQDALTFSAPLSEDSNIVSLPKAASDANGYLDKTDWTAFNAKQDAISGASGTFTSADGKTITVANGIITDITGP